MNGKTGCAIVTDKMYRCRMNKKPALIEFPFWNLDDIIRSATEAILEG